MDVWETLGNELPGRVSALSDLCFWLFTGVCCLVFANIAQYRQRRRSDREAVKANREWRDHLTATQEAHQQQLSAMQSKLLAVQEARLAEIQSEADRAEQRSIRNWKFNAELQKKKSDAGKPE